MAGWYVCNMRDCHKAVDEEWAVIIVEEETRYVYCSEECAKADGRAVG